MGNRINLDVISGKLRVISRRKCNPKYFFKISNSLFGREADKLEHANDDERMYYLREKEPLVNKFISVPKDKGVLNCAVFTAGIIEAVLNACGFSAKVTAHWYNGTTYMIKFDESVIARDKQMDEK